MHEPFPSSIHYEYVENQKEGTLFIFLHGFMGTLEDWKSLPFKPPRGLYIDLPFHGKSEMAPNSIWSNCCETLIKIIQNFEGPRVLVGYSLGGRIALQLIKDYPNEFEKIFCESASFGIENLEEREERKRKDDLLFEKVKDQDSLHRFLKIWYELPIFKAMKNKDHLIQKRLKGCSNRYQLALKVLGPGNQPYIFSELLEHKSKIHFLSGTTDQKYCDLASKWKEHGGEVTYFEGASHNIHNDLPDQFSTLLKNHL